MSVSWEMPPLATLDDLVGITGNITAKEGMEQPKYYWDPNIAPSGMTFYTGDRFPQWKRSAFVGGLREGSGRREAGKKADHERTGAIHRDSREVEQGNRTKGRDDFESRNTLRKATF